MNTPPPNKLTLIASIIYGLSTPLPSAKGSKAIWTELDDEQRKPFIAASEFLLAHIFGATLQNVDRAKLAALLEKQAPDVDANANSVVSAALNLISLLG